MKSKNVRVLLASAVLMVTACKDNSTTKVEKSEAQIEAKISNLDEKVNSNSNPFAVNEISSQPHTKAWESEEQRDLSFAGVKDPRILKEFLMNIRNSAKNNDREAIADMVFYPFNTYQNGVIKKTYATKNEFLHDYDSILSSATQQKLETVNYDSFFSNWRGGAVDRGIIWFNTFEGELKITHIGG